MKHALIISAALGLSACATTADLSRISDQTYIDGKGVQVLPTPRPVRAVDPCRIWNERTSPSALIDDCGGNEMQAPEAPSPQPKPVAPVVPVDPKAVEPPVKPPVEPPKPKPCNAQQC